MAPFPRPKSNFAGCSAKRRCQIKPHISLETPVSHISQPSSRQNIFSKFFRIKLSLKKSSSSEKIEAFEHPVSLL
ncbi:hypothetical protein OROGR_012919 [Orobanche gracilis]